MTARRCGLRRRGSSVLPFICFCTNDPTQVASVGIEPTTHGFSGRLLVNRPATLNIGKLLLTPIFGCVRWILGFVEKHWNPLSLGLFRGSNTRGSHRIVLPSVPPSWSVDIPSIADLYHSYVKDAIGDSVEHAIAPDAYAITALAAAELSHTGWPRLVRQGGYCVGDNLTHVNWQLAQFSLRGGLD